MGRTVVIGAGVIGLACAYALRRRGEPVDVLDRGAPGGAASLGNTGWIVPALSGPVPAPGVVGQSIPWMLKPDSPLYLRPRFDAEFMGWLWSFWRHCTPSAYHAGLRAVALLNARTMQLFDALAADGVPFEMHSDGLLFAFRSTAALRRVGDDLEGMRPYGYAEPRTLSGDEARDAEPALGPGIAGGILIDQQRHVRPESLTAGLVARLSAMGAVIHCCTEATGFEETASGTSRRVRAVRTPAGALDAERVLIAAGAWSAGVARRLGFRLPLQAGKGYSVTIGDPDVRLRRPLYLEEARVAVSSFTGALRLAGTMELSGLNVHMAPRRVEAIRRAADRYLGMWRGGASEHVWVGMRPLTPDGLPVIGRLPGWDNVYLATGHAMLGVTLAPVTAWALAGQILGRPEADLSPFDPARFLSRRGGAAGA